MNTLHSMAIFVRVAQQGAFARAARELRMSPAAVTKHVAALETHVGARLFDRTTRHVSLTEAGRVFLERSRECLQAVDDAETSVRSLSGEASGPLRVTAPVDLQEVLAPAIAAFAARHSKVTLDVRLSNRGVDLVEEGIDVALRVAPALEGSFIARPIAPVAIVLCASPAYLRQHGRPRRPAELAKHRAIVFGEPKPRDAWTFVRDGKRVQASLAASLVTNGGELIRGLAISGAGVAVLPSFLARRALAEETLEQLLPEWTVQPALTLFALYQHRRFVAPKVAAFVTTMKDQLGAQSPWK
ncbi:MAG: LysR family transcriptional regulator [Archangium sp.]